MPERVPVAVGLEAFLTRWEASGAAERANYQLFLTELCDLSASRGPSRPGRTTRITPMSSSGPSPSRTATGSTSAGRIDLYKRGCFVLEAKQGSDRTEPTRLAGRSRSRPGAGRPFGGRRGWDEAMLAARGQAEQYVRALPASEPNPPFLLVVDVGHTIELYADFTRQGRTYIPFPDALHAPDQAPRPGREEIRERLRLVWTDPLDLDPSRATAKVTRDVADRLAKLAQVLEASGHAPEAVAHSSCAACSRSSRKTSGCSPKDGVHGACCEASATRAKAPSSPTWSARSGRR